MSLLSDSDYLIHHLHLSYLRHAQDPYAARLLSLNQNYSQNPWIVLSGLADDNKWPEINLPTNPTFTEDEVLQLNGSVRGKPGRGRANKRDSHSAAGFPAATGLKYTTTIMGNRTGGIGMRVHGKRAHTSHGTDGRSDSPLPTVTETRRIRSDSAPNPVHSTDESASQQASSSRDPILEKRRSVSVLATQFEASSPTESQSHEGDEDGEATPIVPFHPPFARAAEMEARRKARMKKFKRARIAAGDAANNLSMMNLSSSSDSESGEVEDSEIDSDFGPKVDEDTPNTAAFSPSTSGGADVDNFSPGSVGSLGPGAKPNGIISTLAGKRPPPLQFANAGRTRRSALRSPALGNFMDLDHSGDEESMSGGELLSPTKTTRRASRSSIGLNGAGQGQSKHSPTQSPISESAPKSPTSSSTHDQHAEPSPKLKPPTPLTFTRIKPPAVSSSKSFLSALLAQSNGNADNPFSALYASVAARRGVDSYTLTVFFPFATKSTDPMELSVHRDSSVEEVIGFGLWKYWEDGWKPSLDNVELGGKARSKTELTDDEKKIRFSAIGWSMRIAEEDGEVDEDFPPLDRAKKISSFNLDAYAITPETSSTQITKNAEYDTKVMRRPSRIRAPTKPSSNTLLVPPVPTVPGGLSVTQDIASSALTGESMITSHSLGPSPHQGPTLFLRIRIADQPNVVHVSTTIPVSAGTYMAEALEMVCRKRKLDNPKEWGLMLSDPRIPIPLDRTVASLQGKTELLLVKRSDYPTMSNTIGRATDPNASILKRMSEIPESMEDFAIAYKKFNVTRKLPVLGHNDRTLAVDGDYIHIMPAGSKGGFLESSKTASYHVRSVVQCSRVGGAAAFKLVVRREGASKRYDFEAESAKQAEEIVQTVRTVRDHFKTERNGMSRSKSRKSRVVATVG